MSPRRRILCVVLVFAALIPALVRAQDAPRIVNMAVARISATSLLSLVCVATTVTPTGGVLTAQEATGPLTVTLQLTDRFCGEGLPLLQGQGEAEGAVLFEGVTVMLADGSAATLQRGQSISGVTGAPAVEQMCQVDVTSTVLMPPQGCSGPGVEGALGSVRQPQPTPRATAPPQEVTATATATASATFACGTYLTGAMCQAPTSTPTPSATDAPPSATPVPPSVTATPAPSGLAGAPQTVATATEPAPPPTPTDTATTAPLVPTAVPPATATATLPPPLTVATQAPFLPPTLPMVVFWRGRWVGAPG